MAAWKRLRIDRRTRCEALPCDDGEVLDEATCAVRLGRSWLPVRVVADLSVSAVEGSTAVVALIATDVSESKVGV